VGGEEDEGEKGFDRGSLRVGKVEGWKRGCRCKEQFLDLEFWIVLRVLKAMCVGRKGKKKPKGSLVFHFNINTSLTKRNTFLHLFELQITLASKT